MIGIYPALSCALQIGKFSVAEGRTVLEISLFDQKKRFGIRRVDVVRSKNNCFVICECGQESRIGDEGFIGLWELKDIEPRIKVFTGD